jgi:hypothetical protein
MIYMGVEFSVAFLLKALKIIGPNETFALCVLLLSVFGVFMVVRGALRFVSGLINTLMSEFRILVTCLNAVKNMIYFIINLPRYVLISCFTQEGKNRVVVPSKAREAELDYNKLARPLGLTGIVLESAYSRNSPLEKVTLDKVPGFIVKLYHRLDGPDDVPVFLGLGWRSGERYYTALHNIVDEEAEFFVSKVDSNRIYPLGKPAVDPDLEMYDLTYFETSLSHVILGIKSAKIKVPKMNQLLQVYHLDFEQNEAYVTHCYPLTFDEKPFHVGTHSKTSAGDSGCCVVQKGCVVLGHTGGWPSKSVNLHAFLGPLYEPIEVDKYMARLNPIITDDITRESPTKEDERMTAFALRRLRAAEAEEKKARMTGTHTDWQGYRFKRSVGAELNVKDLLNPNLRGKSWADIDEEAPTKVPVGIASADSDSSVKPKALASALTSTQKAKDSTIAVSSTITLEENLKSASPTVTPATEPAKETASPAKQQESLKLSSKSRRLAKLKEENERLKKLLEESRQCKVTITPKESTSSSQ